MPAILSPQISNPASESRLLLSPGFTSGYVGINLVYFSLSSFMTFIPEAHRDSWLNPLRFQSSSRPSSIFAFLKQKNLIFLLRNTIQQLLVICARFFITITVNPGILNGNHSSGHSQTCTTSSRPSSNFVFYKLKKILLLFLRMFRAFVVKYLWLRLDRPKSFVPDVHRDSWLRSCAKPVPNSPLGGP